jgi:hypothetical protein
MFRPKRFSKDTGATHAQAAPPKAENRNPAAEAEEGARRGARFHEEPAHVDEASDESFPASDPPAKY